MHGQAKQHFMLQSSMVVTSSTGQVKRVKNKLTSSRESGSPIFVRDRLALIISLSLVCSAIVAWIATYYLIPLTMMMTPPESAGMLSGVVSVVSSPSLTSITIFETVWIIGMIAMMFPAMIPIVLFYNRIVIKQESSGRISRATGTPLFLGGYLIVYALLGILLFLAISILVGAFGNFPIFARFSILASSALLAFAGVYQFTSLKRACLSKCVSPIGFFALHYTSGALGAMKMGLRHGMYCVGCCWAFMLVMLAVGAMSIPVMAALAATIALEKILVKGTPLFNGLLGSCFIALGIGVLIFPKLLMML